MIALISVGIVVSATTIVIFQGLMCTIGRIKTADQKLASPELEDRSLEIIGQDPIALFCNGDRILENNIFSLINEFYPCEAIPEVKGHKERLLDFVGGAIGVLGSEVLKIEGQPSDNIQDQTWKRLSAQKLIQMKNILKMEMDRIEREQEENVGDIVDEYLSSDEELDSDDDEDEDSKSDDDSDDSARKARKKGSRKERKDDAGEDLFGHLADKNGGQDSEDENSGQNAAGAMVHRMTMLDGQDGGEASGKPKYHFHAATDDSDNCDALDTDRDRIAATDGEEDQSGAELGADRRYTKRRDIGASIGGNVNTA